MCLQAPTAPARASSGLARGSGGGLEESPAWSHYLRGTQGVLALVVVVLTASQPEGGAGGGGGTGWRALPPFRYLLAVAGGAVDNADADLGLAGRELTASSPVHGGCGCGWPSMARLLYHLGSNRMDGCMHVRSLPLQS